MLQRITSTVDTREHKCLLMDLDISMRSAACLYTVHFYGAMFRDGDVWICMEVMLTSLDKFYPKVYAKNKVFPEEFVGKIAYSVSNRHIISFSCQYILFLLMHESIRYQEVIRYCVFIVITHTFLIYTMAKFIFIPINFAYNNILLIYFLNLLCRLCVLFITYTRN